MKGLLTEDISELAVASEDSSGCPQQIEMSDLQPGVVPASDQTLPVSARLSAELECLPRIDHLTTRVRSISAKLMLCSKRQEEPSAAVDSFTGV